VDERTARAAADQMVITAARALAGARVCFVGIGLPSIAANLARHVVNPELQLVYESGTIGARPPFLPLSIGDGVLAETAESVVSVPEIFNYWLQPGRIDVGFLGAAQIDRYANLNSTVIGSYEHPTVRLPGAGGAPEIAASCGEVFVMLRQSLQSFVAAVDFVTTVGHRVPLRDRGKASNRPGGDAAWGESRHELGLIGRGPTKVITDRGVLEPDPMTGELVLTFLHPGSNLDEVRAATGWPLVVSESLEVTAPPSKSEHAALTRLLQARP
jgi:glutaconate CoA-transferase subunit B